MNKDNHSEDFHSSSTKLLDFASVMNRAVCIIVVLLIGYRLFMCALAFAEALDDMRTFEDLGFSHSLWYYLSKNQFPEESVFLMCLVIEFLLYVVQYQRVERKKTFAGSILYFAGMMVFHAVIWSSSYSMYMLNDLLLDMNSIKIWYFFHYAKSTIYLSVAYFAVFSLRVIKSRRYLSSM